MRPFRYLRATDSATAVEQAASVGAGAGAAFIGGGTCLVDLMKLDVQNPAVLIDVSTLAPEVARAGAGIGTGASTIEETTEGLFIGAQARNSDVAHHPLVQSRYPVLSEALMAGASPQVRNMATVGGNLMQRTRCAYFRDVGTPACNKRTPGSGCAAQEGWTRMHAVLGGSNQCIAVHPSDMCVALLALDAVVHTRRRQGVTTRAIPIAELHVVPGEQPQRETVLEPGELITHVTLPPSPFAARSRYVKVRDRASFAFALASAAVALDLRGDGTIKEARVALGGVATKPWRCPEVEKALIGQHATRATFTKAAALAMQDARTTPDNAFKVALGRRTIVRALERAAGVPA
ncbi:MAG TPA: xanthine dehydrogenase family protein subunit M [Polyangia bacterium]|nr:xanthine dehydrogenase family protein subunit M [Polyangia bacterium]